MKNTIMDRALKGEFVLISECGVNYYDIAKEKGITPMEAAKLMVLEARRAGIHAVKFQTYKAGTLAAKESPYYWDINEEPTRSQYELFQKFDSFGAAEYRELADYCEEIGIEFLSTAFDFESADYLDSMMNIYKVSSSDISNLPFVAYQAKKNKTIMLSVGASNADEIDRAVEVIRKYNDKPLILMHCVLEYPTPYEHANLNKIVSLKERYKDVIIGYSDHTKPDSGFVGENDRHADGRRRTGRGQSGKFFAALPLQNRMDIVGGQPQRGAAEVNRTETVNHDLLRGFEFPIAQTVGHDRHQRRGRHSECYHVGERIHLQPVHARRVEEPRRKTVERIEHHCKTDDQRTDGKYPKRVFRLLHASLIRAQRPENRRESAEGIAQC